MDQERARDLLANERTFLAWLRTAIGIVVFGFAIARFSLAIRQLGMMQGRPIASHGGASLWLGNLAIFFGIGVIFAALARFNSTKRQLETGDYSSHSGLIWIVAGVSALFALALAAYLITTGQTLG